VRSKFSAFELQIHLTASNFPYIRQKIKTHGKHSRKYVWMYKLSKPTFVAAALLTVTTSSAFADRDPTLEERSQIQNRLILLGYTNWDEIELDTDRGLWEIDNARASNGMIYDLKLTLNSLELVKQQIDD